VRYGGRAPTAVPGADGRPRVGRAQPVEWLIGLNLPNHHSPPLLRGTDWFHSQTLPPSVESTIYSVYSVNRTSSRCRRPTAAAAGGGGDQHQSVGPLVGLYLVFLYICLR
jgi:hypothetical protein